MATVKGQDFIDKYKNQSVDKGTWAIMYKKGHITIDEFAECTNLTEEEKAEYKEQQNDNCSEPTTEEKIFKLEKTIADLEIEQLK